jgi:hypothetical protein
VSKNATSLSGEMDLHKCVFQHGTFVKGIIEQKVNTSWKRLHWLNNEVKKLNNSYQKSYIWAAVVMD